MEAFMLIEKFELGEKGKKGWVINHKNCPAAVCITPNEGDLQLHMEDMPCGIVLPGQSVIAVNLKEDDRPRLVVSYNGMGSSPAEHVRELNIGNVPPKLILEARHFVQSLMDTFQYNAEPKVALV